MNNRVRLTIPRIQSLACPTVKSQTFLWDTSSPCLAVRATPTRKTFIFESRFDGMTIRTTIGDIFNLTIEVARRSKWSKSYYGLHQRLIQIGGEKRNRSKQPTIAGPLYPLAEIKPSDLTSGIKKMPAAEAGEAGTPD